MLNFRSDTIKSAVHATGVTYSAIWAYQLNHDSELTQNSLRSAHQFNRSRAFGGVELTLHQLD